MRTAFPTGLVILMIFVARVVGYLTYKFGEGSALAVIGILSFMYTIIKPITEDFEERTKKKKIPKVFSINPNKLDNFAKDINLKIELLVEEGSSIVEVNILSTKRAVIQYYEK